MSPAIIGWAVQRRRPQPQIVKGFRTAQNYITLLPHGRDHTVEPVQLYIEERAGDLGRSRAVRDKRLHAVGAALPVDMAGIDSAADSLGHVVVIDGHPTAFTAGHVLVVIETEAARVTESAKLPAL